MAGPTIARNYADVSKLITSHQNAIFEVNGDGSIRTQSLKEKIGNLGLRITGKFTATKAEKDAKVAQAILGLYQKTNPTSNLPYFDPKNNKDYARFFNPQSLVKRKVEKEVKSTTGPVLAKAIHNKTVESLKVPAQKVLFDSLATTFYNLSTDKEYRADWSALENLASTYSQKSKSFNTEAEADAALKTLQDDLKQAGLKIGSGPLASYDISKGIVEWARDNGLK
jgi:hypothetical protein